MNRKHKSKHGRAELVSGVLLLVAIGCRAKLSSGEVVP
jgi:hypothetical protein